MVEEWQFDCTLRFAPSKAVRLSLGVVHISKVDAITGADSNPPWLHTHQYLRYAKPNYPHT
jgi:hypothetical protein